LFGVYDGHGNNIHFLYKGVNGHLVSNFVKQNLADFFSKVDKYVESSITYTKNMTETEKLELYNESRDNFLCNLANEKMYNKYKESNSKIIKESYSSVSKALHSVHFDCNLSGTTAVSVLLVGNKIICFNAGDSRAILVSSTKNKEGIMNN